MNTKLALTLAALGCLTPAHGALLFYEGFNYPTGSLDGNGGWTSASGDIQVSLNGVTNAGTGGYNGSSYIGSYTGVTTTGGYIHNSDTVADYASISLAPSVTSTFTDGSVTWISMINVRGDNGANARYGLAIGADVLTGQRWGNEMAGDGIGFTTASTGNDTRAAVWTPTVAADDYTLGGAVPGGTGRDRFEVAKITWGAVTDTIEIAFFDAGATMTEAAWDAATKSMILADLDQSTFDTLSFTSGSVNFDEIRIATDFTSVISGTVVIPEPSTALLGGLGLLALLRRRRN